MTIKDITDPKVAAIREVLNEEGLDQRTTARIARSISAAERCVQIAERIPAGKWTTYGDISEAVYGNRLAGRAVGQAHLPFAPTEPWSHRIRLEDGTISASRSKDGRTPEVCEAIEDTWNAKARSEGIFIFRRTGAALLDQRLTVAELAAL